MEAIGVGVGLAAFGFWWLSPVLTPLHRLAPPQEAVSAHAETEADDLASERA